MSLLRNDFPCPGGVALLFDQPISLLGDMREAVTLLTTIIADRLRRDRLRTRKVTVWLETQYSVAGGAELASHATDLPVPVNDGRLLAVFTCGAVDELYRPSVRYRAAGVYCEELTVDDTGVATQVDHAGRRTARPYGAVQRLMARYRPTTRDDAGLYPCPRLPLISLPSGSVSTKAVGAASFGAIEVVAGKLWERAGRSSLLQ